VNSKHKRSLEERQKEMRAVQRMLPRRGQPRPDHGEAIERARKRFMAHCLLVQGIAPALVAEKVRVPLMSLLRWMAAGRPLA
jgi:hypothetical protein